MTDVYRELLIGCGRARDKRIWPRATYRQAGDTKFGSGLVTLDVNLSVKPDWFCDLNSAPPWYAYPRDIKSVIGTVAAPNIPGGEHPYQVPYELLPDYWDEIHAYEVLEHLGSLGDAVALLRQFQELWRLLKPDGFLCATVPSRSSGWLWGDPSHRRAIVPQTLTFLDQSEYIRQCDGPRPTSMSDFRSFYKGDFQLIDSGNNNDTFSFVLRAVKPSRWVEPVMNP